MVLNRHCEWTSYGKHLQVNALFNEKKGQIFFGKSPQN